MIVNHGLDCGVNELYDEHKNKAGYEDEVLNKTDFKDERERQENGREDDFLAKGVFVLKRGAQTFEGIIESVEDTPEAALTFTGTGLVFHG
jgi:hypothetical protein